MRKNTGTGKNRYRWCSSQGCLKSNRERNLIILIIQVHDTAVSFDDGLTPIQYGPAKLNRSHGRMHIPSVKSGEPLDYYTSIAGKVSTLSIEIGRASCRERV